MKRVEIHAFDIPSDLHAIDLYLLPMERMDFQQINDKYKYPRNGIILDGDERIFHTNCEHFKEWMEDHFGGCYVLRRSSQRYVVWFESLEIAERALKEMKNPQFLVDNGFQVFNDGIIPCMCDDVFTWINYQQLY